MSSPFSLRGSRGLLVAFWLLGGIAVSKRAFAQEPPNAIDQMETQQPTVPKPVPVPVPKALPAPSGDVPEPLEPPPRDFVDPKLRVSFRLASGWNLSLRDHEVSTFHLDARTAPPATQLKAVASLAFNPFPQSTFSGAFFYLSVTPHSSELACVAQAHGGAEKPLNNLPVAKIPFARGLDEHGQLCTEVRNVTYTAMRGRSCLRFDLTVNTFCGGDVTGVKELTTVQLAKVFRRMEDILNTVQFEPR